jgi:retron-type reverse transcriptase
MDLKDFFPSIGPRRVHGMWREFFGAGEQTAWHLTRVTTFADHLCQGFCTSPAISNLIVSSLDTRLEALARSKGFVYTRYADDLTFSHRKWRGEVDFLLDAVAAISGEEGFRINRRKTQVMRRGRRQKVLGLVVNDKVSVPRRTRRLIRSAVDHWPQQSPERRAQISGWLSYMRQIHPSLNYESGQAAKSSWDSPIAQGRFECR